MFKNIDDYKNDFFLNPIPKWITHFGVGVMIFFIILIYFIATQISFPKLVQTQVVVKDELSYVKVHYSTFEQLNENQNIRVKLPYIKLQYVGKLSINKSWAEADSVVIPIYIDKNLLKRIPFKGSIKCPGSITFGNYSIIDRLYRSRINDNSL
ncbi:hypothetical protein [Spirosoma sordidisoli]|uniref:Uncharacterized protein n=1 Tax=Spirosoma sordidisoli TaxID=2502893 RepID=A0A4Q2UJL5_9BACT|nr:hypothetical protein [Spirosoma sordidisoli]RYC66949.1 hypothetical protein EQG79_26590 [Spirosoma sordidisoli]